MRQKRIAIVYDWMDSWGGVERMLLVLHEMFPEAQWYTSYVNRETAPWVSILQKIHTSFIQNLPSYIKTNRILSLPLYPSAFENIDLRGYDLVISVSSSFAKSVITHPGTKHVCILLTPTRWLWSQEKNYMKEIPALAGMTIGKAEMAELIARPFINHLKKWDFIASKRPDKIISISKAVADRCKVYYHRESEVLYPPFDYEYWGKFKFQNSNFKFQKILKPSYSAGRQVHDDKGEYFLVVSRLEPYKKVDLVIESFRRFPKKQLIIVGSGTQFSKLKIIAGENIHFIQHATDAELGQLYADAQALIMPQEEDFGYVALEAQFFGCPVIAYERGGAVETVVKGKTGLFFSQQSSQSLGDAVAQFERRKYNLGDSQAFLKKFSKELFIKKTKLLITDELL